jgi:glycosyltransferase involved in cell wall biosynthesis
MRILMLDNEFPPLGGGTGVVNSHHMQELDGRDGIEIDLVTSSRSRDRYEIERFGSRSRVFKVPVDNLNIHHSTYTELLRYAWRGWRQSWRLMRRQRYDICWAYSTVPAGFIAFLLGLLAKLPYIVITQGPDIPWHEQRHYWVYGMLTPIIKLIWRRAAQVTAPSIASREEILRISPDLPVTVISNGVDTERFAPTPDTIAQRGLSSQLTFLCVGRLIALKGQQYILDAAAHLCQRGYQGRFKILFVGTGDNEDHLRTQVDQLGLLDLVEFAGVVPHADMPAQYARANVFVLPSYNEAMSMALLEALAAGLPAVVTDTGGTSELINGNGMIVRWSDSVGLADALEQYLLEPQLCRTMGEQSRQIAQNFSWSAAVEAYIRVSNAAMKATDHGRARVHM